MFCLWPIYWFWYTINSNKESGDGRPDVIVHDVYNNYIAIIEVKFTSDEKKFNTLSISAEKQITRLNYEKPYRNKGYTKILHWGLAFYKKECRAHFLSVYPIQ